MCLSWGWGGGQDGGESRWQMEEDRCKKFIVNIMIRDHCVAKTTSGSCATSTDVYFLMTDKPKGYPSTLIRGADADVSISREDREGTDTCLHARHPASQDNLSPSKVLISPCAHVDFSPEFQ